MLNVIWRIQVTILEYNTETGVNITSVINIAY